MTSAEDEKGACKASVIRYRIRPSWASARVLTIVLMLVVLRPAVLQAETGTNHESADSATEHERLDRELLELRSRIADYSFRCYGSASKLVGPDSLRSGCTIPSRFTGDGDSTLWNGLLCFTGRNPWACEAVKNSMSEEGRIWRSPRRRESQNDGNDYPQASFSRDMARGVQLYLLQTRDRETALSWSRYISSTGAYCPDHFDYSCDLRTQSYRRLNHVLETVDVPQVGFASTVFPCLWPAYPVTSAMHETMMEKRVSENHGFHLHLAAIDLLMDPHLVDPLYDEESRKKMARRLFERKPYNLFFQYLAEGPTLNLKRKILSMAPRQRPPFLSQWVWEREIPPRDLTKFSIEKEAMESGERSQQMSAQLEKAFQAFVALESMGWDFVFLIDLVLHRSPEQHGHPLQDRPLMRTGKRNPDLVLN